MNRLRNRLIFIFLLATLLPLGLTLRITLSLLKQSLDLSPLAELDAVSAKAAYDAQEKMYEARKDLFNQGALPRRDLEPDPTHRTSSSGVAPRK